MRMPLHIFEERYRIMIRECIEEDAPFGVVLIKAGAEAGSGAVPHDIGTTARILQVEYLEDGRLNIFTTGHERFRIVAINTTQPYLRAEVSVLQQEPSTDSAYAALPRARQMFDDYLKTYLALAGQWTRGIYLPDDPADAADYMAARMEIGPDPARAGDPRRSAAWHARPTRRAPAAQDERLRSAELSLNLRLPLIVPKREARRQCCQ